MSSQERVMDVSPSEFKALYNALDYLLTKNNSLPGEVITLNLKTLQERLQEQSEEVFVINTGKYWGFWKCITRNEIEWYLTRLQVIKLRAALFRAMMNKRRQPIIVSKPWLDALPVC